MLIVEYSFAVIAYLFIHESYMGYCDDLFLCFITTLDQTFKVRCFVLWSLYFNRLMVVLEHFWIQLETQLPLHTQNMKEPTPKQIAPEQIMKL